MKKVAALLFALITASLHAEQSVVPLPTDSRLVQFVYDPNNTFTILGRPGDITAIQLGADEQLVAMAAGDTLRWIIAKAPGFIFVKPTEKELVTSATVITTKRSYQLTFRSGPIDGRFYQRVSWSYPESMVITEDVPLPPSPASPAQPPRQRQADSAGQQSQDPTAVDAVNLEKLNFNYTVSGKADFKPEQVFDDGKFTWLKMPEGIQAFPAVFILASEKAQAQVPNFVVKGRFIVIQRRVHQAILRLGEDEVRVTVKKSFWGD